MTREKERKNYGNNRDECIIQGERGRKIQRIAATAISKAKLTKPIYSYPFCDLSARGNNNFDRSDEREREKNPVMVHSHLYTNISTHSNQLINDFFFSFRLLCCSIVTGCRCCISNIFSMAVATIIVHGQTILMISSRFLLLLLLFARPSSRLAVLMNK